MSFHTQSYSRSNPAVSDCAYLKPRQALRQVLSSRVFLFQHSGLSSMSRLRYCRWRCGTSAIAHGMLFNPILRYIPPVTYPYQRRVFSEPLIKQSSLGASKIDGDEFSLDDQFD